MRGGRRKTTHVEQRSPADHRQVGVTVQTGVTDGAADSLDVGRIVLDALAPRQQQRRASQRQRVGVPFEIAFDHRADRTAVFHLLIHHEEHAHGAARLAASGQDDLTEGEVRRGEKIGREMNVVVKVDANVAGDGLHGLENESDTPKGTGRTQKEEPWTPPQATESGVSPMQPASVRRRTFDTPSFLFNRRSHHRFMKILITGGAGFIGSHIAAAYVRDGHEVAVLDNFRTGSKRHLPAAATLFVGDISQASDVAAVFQQFQPEAVSHHAAQLDVRQSLEDPAHDAATNILGGLNVLLQAARGGVRRFIFASSGGAIYGETERLPADEETPARPLSPYGLTKWTFESYLHIWRQVHGIAPVILRYANVYGPRQNSEGEAGVIAMFSRRLLRGKACTIYGDGGSTRDYVYVGDVVRANQLALTLTEGGHFQHRHGTPDDHPRGVRHGARRGGPSAGRHGRSSATGTCPDASGRGISQRPGQSPGHGNPRLDAANVLRGGRRSNRGMAAPPRLNVTARSLRPVAAGILPGRPDEDHRHAARDPGAGYPSANGAGLRGHLLRHGRPGGCLPIHPVASRA